MSLAVRSCLALAAAAGLVGAAHAQSPAPKKPAAAKPAAAPADKAKAERGKYLVTAGGCHDCHTPKTMGAHGPEWDLTRALSGHPESLKLPPPPPLSGPWIAVGNADLTAWAGPWGISYAANLTPDENTGMGIWTEDMFVKAMKTGRHMGTSRPILPPMPIEAIRNYTEDDLKAMYAYLRTIPAIKNRVPEPVPPAGPPAGSPARP